MNVFEIVHESKLDEFKIPGDDAQEFISDERLKELGFDKSKGAGIFRPYGNDNSPWVYSPQSVKILLQEAMAIYTKYMITDAGNFAASWFQDVNREKRFEEKFYKFLSTDGKIDWNNAKKILIHAGKNSNPKITHAEALGIMLNYILLITKKMAS